MKSIEERLWDYIDDTCDADEKASMEKMLQADPAVKLVYQEFLSINESLKAVDLEEPSMRFTQNVMDQIKLEPMPKPLRTKIDKRIINGIGGFFIVTLSILIGYSLTQLDFSAGWDLSFSLPQVDWSQYFGSAFVQGSFIVLAVLALFSVDGYRQYRKRVHSMS